MEIKPIYHMAFTWRPVTDEVPGPEYLDKVFAYYFIDNWNYDVDENSNIDIHVYSESRRALEALRFDIQTDHLPEVKS